MSNNQTCFCGVPAQIACKCLSNLNYFCLTHLGQHMIDDPHNHRAMTLAQIRVMQDPVAKLMNLKLSKIEIKLHEYQNQIEFHLSGLTALNISMKQSIDTIFQDYANKYQISLTNVKNMREKIDNYIYKDSSEASVLIEKYKAQELEGILSNYHHISQINITSSSL